MKPRVMFEFQRSLNPHALPPTRFRVVDKAGFSGSNDPNDTNAVIEKLDGYDAMHVERWVKAGDEGVRALLNELIYFNVTPNKPKVEEVEEVLS